MTTEEYLKKRVIVDEDIMQLTRKQMDEIANHPPKKPRNREYTYEERLKMSLAMKEYWFKKKNAK